MAPSAPTVDTIAHDPAALAAVFDAVAASGRGWVNVVPELPEGTQVPATPNAFAVFNKRGPVVPLGTYVPPHTGRNGTVPSELGIQHGTSIKGTEALADSDAAVPADWRILADHPRKGTSLQPPADTTTLRQATWLLAALQRLCLPPHTGRFIVARYEG
ncbi:MAG: hypothetical protein GX868_11250 [Actinobacteria bacterium]|nr:hypothetical protein [Actinomycetota bacterium]